MNDEKLTTANKALFFGIIAGFIFLFFLLWWLRGYSDITIPLIVFICIIIAAIGLLLNKESAAAKRAKE